MIINRQLLLSTQSDDSEGWAEILTRVRILGLVGLALILAFMWVELTSVPEFILKPLVDSRIQWQVIPILSVLGISYLPNFYKAIEPVICALFIWLTLANYHLIYTCWVNHNYSFHYEATLLYTFYAFFLIGMNFRWALIYAITNSIGFAVLVLNWAMYSHQTHINLTFVIMTQVIALIGLWYVNNAFRQTHAAKQKIISLSQTDHLTKLLNRREFEKQLDNLFKLSQRPPLSICVFMVDMDFFKDYNDGYGHQQGDQAIKLQSDILKNVFKRDIDLIGRYGGEEFIVAISNIKEEQGQRLAQSILDRWSEERLPHGKGKGQEFMSCSIGFKFGLASQFKKPEDMIQLADQALYMAKDSGRACFKQAP